MLAINENVINANEVFGAKNCEKIKFPPKISNNLAPKFVVKYDLFRAETLKKRKFPPEKAFV
jgi:hypothetical protein